MFLLNKKRFTADCNTRVSFQHFEQNRGLCGMKKINKTLQAVVDYKDNYIVLCLIFYVFDIIITLHNCATMVHFIIDEIQYSLNNEYHLEFVLYSPLPYILDALLIISIFYHFIILIIASIKSNRWKWLSISAVLMFITECVVEVTRYFTSGRPMITYYTFEVLVLFIFHAINLSLKKEWWKNWSTLYPKYPYISMAKRIASKKHYNR